jgi:plasminogen activator
MSSVPLQILLENCKEDENIMIKILIVSIFCVVLSNGAYALNEKTSYTIYENSNSNSISVGIGLLNGESEELVYSGGRKTSELTWKLENVQMFGVEMETKLAQKIHFNASFWTKLNYGSGEVDDYDWMNPDANSWTNYSNHKTKLDKAYMLDLSLEYKFTQGENHNFSASFGFKHDRFKWEAYDGDGTYLVYDDKNYRGSDIFFYGEVMTYDQELYTPYIGLNFNYQKNSWILNMYLRGSFWAWGEAEDVHYFPAQTLGGEYTEAGVPTLYKDDIDDIHYLSYGAKLNYFFREDVLIGIAFDLQDYFRTKGKGEVIGGATYDAGLSHYSYMISIMTEYRF